MKLYPNYLLAERELVKEIIMRPEFITPTTFEIIGASFALNDPLLNRNDHSKYDYAEEFFQWMMTGDKTLSEGVLKLNAWSKRFVDSTGLPDSFSTTYGWKIKKQLPTILSELDKHRDSRRAYINILTPDDQIVLTLKTTHEYPCTIGLQTFVRNDKVHMIANMRSNNAYAVMPYDVYNFTRLQQHIASELKLDMGTYYHQINSAHVYKGDARRLRETYLLKS